MTQAELARQFGVSDVTMANWELDKVKPDIKRYPTLIKFIGSEEFLVDAETFPSALLRFRQTQGLDQGEAAQHIGISHRSWAAWELGERFPLACLKQKLGRVCKLSPDVEHD